MRRGTKIYSTPQHWLTQRVLKISFATNVLKQGRKRLLDTPKRMIKRREREGKREKER